MWIDQDWEGTCLDKADRTRLDLTRVEDGIRMRIDAPFHNDPKPDAGVGWTEGLWNHEVVELFVAGPERYLEVEVGPWGHHLALAFEGVRQRTEERLELEAFPVWRRGSRWGATLQIPLAWIPKGPVGANAFAAHGPPDDRRYVVAHTLPGDRPDFHQPSRFPPMPVPFESAG